MLEASAGAAAAAAGAFVHPFDVLPCVDILGAGATRGGGGATGAGTGPCSSIRGAEGAGAAAAP